MGGVEGHVGALEVIQDADLGRTNHVLKTAHMRDASEFEIPEINAERCDEIVGRAGGDPAKPAAIIIESSA